MSLEQTFVPLQRAGRVSGIEDRNVEEHPEAARILQERFGEIFDDYERQLREMKSLLVVGDGTTVGPGLSSMQERVSGLGDSFELVHEPGGAGAKVRLPLMREKGR